MNRQHIWRTSLVLGVCFVFVSLFSENLIIVHEAHDCCGTDCPICFLVQGAENFSRQFKYAVLHPGLPAGAFLLNAFLRIVIFYGIPISAVRLKTKMNT
jgi:hypothetical protein